jgi:hypothetical protein
MLSLSRLQVNTLRERENVIGEMLDERGTSEGRGNRLTTDDWSSRLLNAATRLADLPTRLIAFCLSGWVRHARRQVVRCSQRSRTGAVAQRSPVVTTASARRIERTLTQTENGERSAERSPGDGGT